MLRRAGRVPAPDAIRLDAEGHEHEALPGFDDRPGDRLGVGADARFTPTCRGTKLLRRLVELPGSCGMVLRRPEPINAFDGDLVACNACFTGRREQVRRLDDARRRTFDRLAAVWELPPYWPPPARDAS